MKSLYWAWLLAYRWDICNISWQILELLNFRRIHLKTLSAEFFSEFRPKVKLRKKVLKIFNIWRSQLHFEQTVSFDVDWLDYALNSLLNVEFYQRHIGTTGFSDFQSRVSFWAPIQIYVPFSFVHGVFKMTIEIQGICLRLKLIIYRLKVFW